MAEGTTRSEQPDAAPGRWILKARALLWRRWLPLSLGLGLVGSPLAYVTLVGTPGVALFVSSLLMLAAFALATALLWPMGSYITWKRRLEVLGYRAGVGAGLYLIVGYVVVMAINLATLRTIPAAWPDAQRFIPFWPFYSWFVVGCEWIGPCPAAP